jgi:hypothetical protein
MHRCVSIVKYTLPAVEADDSNDGHRCCEQKPNRENPSDQQSNLHRPVESLRAFWWSVPGRSMSFRAPTGITCRGLDETVVPEGENDR